MVGRLTAGGAGSGAPARRRAHWITRETLSFRSEGQDNLLVNPGFEQPYENGRHANGWGRWFEDTGKKEGTLDYAVNPDFSAEVNPVIVRSGSAAQHIGNRYDPWHAGVLQSVKVTP